MMVPLFMMFKIKEKNMAIDQMSVEVPQGGVGKKVVAKFQNMWKVLGNAVGLRQVRM